MTEALVQKVEFSGQESVSAKVERITASLAALDKQLRRSGEQLRKTFGADALKSLVKLHTEAKTFGVDAVEAGERIGRAFRDDVAAVIELRGALRGVAAEQKAAAEAVRAAQTGSASGVRRRATSQRDAIQGRARAESDAFRGWRVRQRIKVASERAERREMESNRRLRERGEAAELRHVRTISRERAALRRHAISSGRYAYKHAHHALRSLNHPVHESVGFALAAGAAAGGAFAEHVVRASEAFDTSMARLKMFAPELDAQAIRRTALGDSISLGIDASTIVDSIAKSVRDGVPASIAQYLPKSIAQAAQVMGGNVEGLTDSLAEGLQEASSMGWIKDKFDARRFLNTEAGLATFKGNTSEKQEQFIAAGGLGHGREMGLDLVDTLAFGAMLNASGARTGLASARFMGQLSQNVPKMFDKYREATMSRRNTEEDRAVRSAPYRLGYGGVREMQKSIMAGPNGLIDFATRLQKLDDKARKLVLEGYGFSEQGGAMLAELGANGGAKGKAVLARAHELAEQKEAQDYLSEKFSEWQQSLSFMLKQIEAGWRAIENEIGDVIKLDIVAPFRDWWTLLANSIVHSDLKARMHATIMGLINGLGFDDFRALLDSLSANARGLDVAGFAKGLGEGIRSGVDALKGLAGVFGAGPGGISAETIGRVAAEMLGLSVALRAVAPLLTVISGITETVRAIGAAAGALKAVGALSGIGAAEGAAGGELGAIAAGLGGEGAIALAIGALPVTIGAVLAGTLLAVTIGNWAGIKAYLSGGNVNDASADLGPNATVRNRVLRSVPPSLRSDPSQWSRYLSPAEMQALQFGPDKPAPGFGDRIRGLFHRSDYQGGADGFSGLRQNISWTPSDSAEVTRGAVLDTARGVMEVKASVDRVADLLRLGVAWGGSDDGASGGGFGPGSGRPNIRFGRPGSASGGSALPNMRYGHAKGGGYRGTPGGGNAQEVGPHVSLGKMGAKFAAKAPTIMDGLMKKYGLTREQAAGVVGNLGHESAGFTAYHEGGKEAAKGGVGWAQWTGSRRRDFERWTKAHGLNPTSDEASWRYLTEGDPETAKAILAVKRTTNRRDAVRAWHDSFERSADISHGVIVKPRNWNSRLSYADKAFAAEPKGATVAAGGGKPLGTASNPVVVKVDPRSVARSPAPSPADIVRGVTGAKPGRTPAAGGSGGGGTYTADNSVHHHTWNIHGEPARQAVMAALPSRRGGLTLDIDAFA